MPAPNRYLGAMVSLGVVMDPIDSIHISKDSTFAMLLAAQRRGWALHYMELGDLWLDDGQAHGRTRGLEVQDDPADWYRLDAPSVRALADLDVILMRKDPPIDTDYLYATYILERAEEAGTLVVNRARALRNSNEKLITAWFPQCCPPGVVTRDLERLRRFLDEQQDIIVKPLGTMGGASVFRLRRFLDEQQDIIVKPLGTMGGASVFRLRRGDANTSVILETITGQGRHFVMAQRHIPEISAGDKRILLIDGEPVPWALARLPAPGETRANLAAGGTGEGRPLTDRDRWICEQVRDFVRENGLIFVGLDVIGSYLTEVNVTSPTCIRELDRIYDLDIAGDLMDRIEARLQDRPRQP